jgi:hypothetical protein
MSGLSAVCHGRVFCGWIKGKLGSGAAVMHRLPELGRDPDKRQRLEEFAAAVIKELKLGHSISQATRIAASTISFKKIYLAASGIATSRSRA